jgi:hypothetical protein
MKIALDGFELGRDAKGVGRVIQNILVWLPDLLANDKFLIFTKEGIGKYSHPRTEERLLPWRAGYLRWQNGPLRKALKAANPDLFIASNYILPFACPWKTILGDTPSPGGCLSGEAWSGRTSLSSPRISSRKRS